MHGEIRKAQCTSNEKEVLELAGAELNSGELSSSGHQLRPHVVWFGEAVPKMIEAENITSMADIFIVIGTSLNVYPAANLIYSCKKHCKKYIVDINDLTNVKHKDLIHFKGPASKKTPELVKRILNEFIK